MPSYYWIKLYHEVLHDPKMGRLSDHLWRRFFEFCLIAGEEDAGGYLPSIENMSWTLRTLPGDLETDLHLLNEHSLVTMDPDGSWFVTKFADRQAAVPATERWRRWRDRQRAAEYYQTDSDESANDAQTIRLTDTDIDTDTDKTREDTDTDNNGADAPSVGAVVIALKTFGMSQAEQVVQETTLLPAQIMETMRYATEQGLGAGWVRGQLRQNQAHRPRAPTKDGRWYLEGKWAEIIEH